MCQCRALCILLERIPARFSRFGTWLRKQEINPSLTLCPYRIRYATVERAVDLSPAALGLFVQSRESRQFEAFPNQLFGRHVNDVGQVLHSFRSEANDSGKNDLLSLIKALDS